jgi:hypothetical protein
VTPRRFERPTYRLGICRSILLSYGVIAQTIQTVIRSALNLILTKLPPIILTFSTVIVLCAGARLKPRANETDSLLIDRLRLNRKHMRAPSMNRERISRGK